MGTKIMAPNPRYNIVGPYFDFGGTWSSASISPLKAGRKDAIKEGINIHTKEGTNKCSINSAVVTLSPIHNMVVVTSPMGDHAPPALAAIIMIPAYQILTSRSKIIFWRMEIKTMVAVRLSIMAESMKAKKEKIQSNFFLLLVFTNDFMVAKPSK